MTHVAEPPVGVTPQDNVLDQVADYTRRGERCVLATVVRTKGSTPRKTGAKMLVPADRAKPCVGTIGGGRIEHEIVEAARALLVEAEAQTGDDEGLGRVVTFHLTHDLAMCCGGEMEVFLEPLGRVFRVILVGGGHIHRALSPLLQSLSFDVTVVDDLEELASPERFPGARLVHAWEPVSWGVPLGRDTFVVVASRDHAVDQAVLEALAKMDKSLAYVGCVGSHGKLGRFKKRLLHKEIDEVFVEALRGPVGVEIGAETPEEIAVSIAAELIAVRRGRP
jgi:xanthine dehydrogenase accessory factor